MICLLIIKARGCCVGGNMAVHAYQLHSWEARRDSAVEPDSPALENLDWERACGFSPAPRPKNHFLRWNFRA